MAEKENWEIILTRPAEKVFDRSDRAVKGRLVGQLKATFGVRPRYYTKKGKILLIHWRNVIKMNALCVESGGPA